MFKIRKEQARAYESELVEGFVDRAVRFLRETVPQATAPFSDRELAMRVQRCIHRAARYGLDTEQQVTAFAAATFYLGERFDEDPSESWAADVLRCPDLAPGDKATLLLATARQIAAQNGTEGK